MKAIVVSLFLLLFPFALFSFPDRDARGAFTENFTHLQVKATLHLPSVSYQEGKDIPLEFKIFNHGKEVVRIFPAIQTKETFQFQIRDQENNLVEEIDESISKPWDPRSQKDLLQARRNHIENAKGDASKEIALAPGESFSYRLFLNEKYRLTPGKKYSVIGYFYPNATESKKNLLLGGNESEGKNVFLRTDNSISFFYEKRRIEKIESGIPNISSESGGISPEETVFLFLGAEMKKNWGNYFKWIDFSDFILAYDSFSSEYIEANPRDRDSVVEEFKKYLITLPSGKLKSFKIIGVDSKNSMEARVRVYAERSEERIPTRYEYEYNLRKISENSSSNWKIHGVVARIRK